MNLDFKQLQNDYNNGYNHFFSNRTSPHALSFVNAVIHKTKLTSAKKESCFDESLISEDVLNYWIKKGFKKTGRNGAGRFTLFHSKKKLVVKIPWNGGGIIDNILEFDIWNNRKDYFFKPAACRLLSDYSLLMEKVQCSFDSAPKNIPDWGHCLVDGPQGGMNKSGEWKVFDYANEHWSRR